MYVLGWWNLGDNDMQITIKNAYAHNLKNISATIPMMEITALTGVSGSGKSTLLKDIIGAYGASNYTKIASKTVKDALTINDTVEVDNIENLPNTILIDIRSTITNPISTVSTVSGIHELLRNLINEYGEIRCSKCGEVVKRDFSLIKSLSVDLILNEKFEDAINFIKKHGAVNRIDYFDKNGKKTSDEKKKALASIYFIFNKASEKIIKEFSKSYGCSVCVVSETAKCIYDFEKEIECANCNHIGPNLIRRRMSYRTQYLDGGGACRCCGGSGKILSIKKERIFHDRTKGILNGASLFVNAKGIKYSTVTEKFLEAVYERLNINIETAIDALSEKEIYAILYGINDEIEFTDRIGGKKKLIFEGITAYLDSAYRAHKGGEALLNLFDESICPECQGSRFDSNITSFFYGGETINSFMNKSLSDLGEWCKENITIASKGAKKYIERIANEIENFELLSCGHLALSRASNTLSGGELQRIRVSALLNSDIHGICYLLDEPSSGLHYSDIENLAVLLRKICRLGNTIIIVEHNKKLLSYCDHIIDLGPCGGQQGGNILFNAPINDIDKYDTATTRVMLDEGTFNVGTRLYAVNNDEYIEFSNLTYNNLKNVSVRFPKNSFTVVCGVSGSGKSTFVRRAVLASVESNPISYGFDDVEYLGQENKVTTSISTVLSLTKMGDYIAKLYEKSSGSRLKKNCFMLGSLDGKCRFCGGKGKIYSSADELLGVCDHCKGYGFNEEVLKVYIDGLNIYDLYNMNLEDLGKSVKDVKIKEVSEIGTKLGVGYLTFSRQAKTLSKGEYQRVSLIKTLAGNVKNRLYILDEPSKGLHISDTESLIYMLQKISDSGNTIIAVEHNPEIIRNADYIIEFGGTGRKGGYLLFQGKPNNISGTPTAKMLTRFVAKGTEVICRKEKEIIVDENGILQRYTPHKVYYAQDQKDALLKAAKKAQDVFLSVAIPNNSMFSHIDRNIIGTDTPIMRIIDFAEKVKYNISISEAVGVRRLLCKAADMHNRDSVARYVFDPQSQTGKCVVCGGTGMAASVDENYFLHDGELNTICKKFLKNSTDYMKLSKLMKKDGIDITKKVKAMNREEHMALFWGTDELYEVDGRTERWEGIIPYFIQFHKYYTDKNADEMFKLRSDIVCPVCDNELLKTEYIHYMCSGLSYKEWMSFPIDYLVKKIRVDSDFYIEEIYKRLLLLCKMGLEKKKLGDDLFSLDAVAAGKVKIASTYFNRIYDMGLVVNNMGVISNKEKCVIEEMLRDLASVNTVWIVG